MENTQSESRLPGIRIGPGSGLDKLAALLEALGRDMPESPGITRWSDVAEMLLSGPRDRVVLDADHFPQEDIGIVRRFLVARPGASIEALGANRAAPVSRSLLAMEGVHWHPWPQDLVQLESLLRPVRVTQTAGAAGRDAAERSSLGTPREEPKVADLRSPLVELLAQVRRAGDALESARASGEMSPAQSLHLGAELTRLERGARGLLLESERPLAPAEAMDLDCLVEEELAVLALQSRRAPRVRYHGGEALPVRADRSLLVHALGMLLDLARGLAPQGEALEVRTLAAPIDQDQPGFARAIVRVRAPAGVLSDLSPAQLLMPAGLGERVPGVGPSELCALARLCAQRGLLLEVHRVVGAQALLEFDVSAPLAERHAAKLAVSPG